MNSSQSGQDPWRILVFGASGAIGQAVVDAASGEGWAVTAVTRAPRAPGDAPGNWVTLDAGLQPLADSTLAEHGPFDAVCWAQGANISDSIYSVDEDAAMDLYRTNCLFVVTTLQQLLAASMLRPRGARLCVVSSIWQERARQNKLSYTMTKAAVGGLVRSASADLGADGHLINAVLPGVLDTPMTRAALSEEQIAATQGATLFDALPTPQAVASTIVFLCSSRNTSTTGQSIAVDLGFSHVRIV
ncbi:SDR family oxidoreductase [uncultured Brevundimonas sp.]|uniref:SDR family NAD(P)-dependent oxidoreductase n=1 Tax=uncultured Brevundimonas sp. TaxID=213418 RepID=UPI0030EE11D3